MKELLEGKMEPKMRKWYVPLTVLGVGSLGVLFLTDGGRQRLRWFAANLHRAPEAWLDWNEAAQREIDRIQLALNRVADSLNAAQ
jgi:hypothetical protein